MPILNSNEKYTRDVVNRVANMTGLPASAVRTVLDGVELCILDDLRLKGQKSAPDAKVVIPVEIPNIGTLKLSTTSYPKDKSLSDYTDGKSFKSTIELSKKFLNRIRWAYYANWDYLSQRAEANFSKLFSGHYQSIIRGEDGEE